MTFNAYHPLVAQIGTLIEQRTGLAVNDQFRRELEPLLRGIANGGLDGYLRELRESPETSPAWQKLIYTLTVGETYFFRDQSHFRLLREHLLPTFSLQHRLTPKPQLSIWSAGCATGEEPYSIAMTLYESFPDMQRWMLNLYGTDLNVASLQAAERGIYRKWSFRHTDDTVRARYFTETELGWQINSSIKAMVNFRHANLFAGSPLPQMDVIFCRNVLIYIEDEHIHQLEDMFYNTLAPGGWLLLGQAEAIHFRRERWQTHVFPGTVVYQKPEATPRFTPQLHTAPDLDITHASKPKAIANYRDAVRAFQLDDRAEAERLLAELLSQESQHVQAHILLASIFASRRAMPEAHAHLDRAMKIDSLNADAHYLRALLLLETNKKTDARKEVEAALYCRPTHPLALLMMGNLHAQAGELKRAHRAWEKARAAASILPPNSPISDLSDLTASGLDALIGHRLQDKEPE